MSDTLDELIRELEGSAARLRAGELDATAAAAELVERCAELAGLVGAELDRAGREAERGGSRRRVRSGCCEHAAPPRAATPRRAPPATRPSSKSAWTPTWRPALRRRAGRGPPGGGHALFAARGRQAHPSRAGPGHRRGARARARGSAPVRGGDRDDPHLLADPRRLAGHGRRRPSPRQAHLPRGVRRGRGHPGRRRPVRRGAAPGAHRAGR